MPQVSCHITRTTTKTHQLIRDNLHLTPFTAVLLIVRPRYCPSIEDKIVKFADKESHQIFLEPEGINTPEIYVQGFSTGLPENIQLELLRTLPGLNECKMLRPAYAVSMTIYLQHSSKHHSKRKKLNIYLALDKLMELLVMKKQQHKD